jgi:molybdenum cofactor cytidylyltransferase
MGRPKLVLPLADGESVISRLVRALREGGAEPVLVIVPPLNEAGAPELVEHAERAGAVVVVCPQATAGMRETVEVGLGRLPVDYPGTLLVPGDSPGLTPAIVQAVRTTYFESPGRIVVPTSRGRRGHPIALPRRVCERIAALPEGTGINALVRDPSEEVYFLDLGGTDWVDDMDTPADLARWLGRPSND